MILALEDRIKRIRRSISRRQTMAALFAASLATTQVLFGQQLAPIVNARPDQRAPLVNAHAAPPLAPVTTPARGPAPQATANPYVAPAKNPYVAPAKHEASYGPASAAPVVTVSATAPADKPTGGGESQPAAPANGSSSRRMAKERGVEGPDAAAIQLAPVVKAQPLSTTPKTTQPAPVTKSTAGAEVEPSAKKDEHLAPIVSASSMPKRQRPGTLSAKPNSSSTAAAATPAPDAPQMRIELQSPPSKSADPATAKSGEAASPPGGLVKTAEPASKAAPPKDGSSATTVATTPAIGLPMTTSFAANKAATKDAKDTKGEPKLASAAKAAAAALQKVEAFVGPNSSGEPAKAPAPAVAASEPTANKTASPEAAPASSSDSFETRLANGPDPDRKDFQLKENNAPALSPAKIAAALPQSNPGESPRLAQNPQTALPSSPASNRSTTSASPTAGNTQAQAQSRQPAPAARPKSPSSFPDARTVAANVTKQGRGVLQPFLSPASRNQSVTRAEFETPYASSTRAQDENGKSSTNTPTARRGAWNQQAQVAMNSTNQPTGALDQPLASGPASQTPKAAPTTPAAKLAAGTPGLATPIFETDPLVVMGLPPMPPQSLASSSPPQPAVPVASSVQEDPNRTPVSPFEPVKESGTVKLRAGSPLLLRTKSDVYRAAVVDQDICDVERITLREISIVPRAAGRTHVTFFFDDPQMPQLTYLVDVQQDSFK